MSVAPLNSAVTLLRTIKHASCAGIAGLVFFSPGSLFADDSNVLRQVESLQKENEELKNLVRQQGSVIEKLNERVNNLEKNNTPKSQTGEATEAKPPKSSGFSLGRINISGEGGVGFFDSQKNGIFPNNEFRVDEAKLFVEAPIWGDVYFFTEINLAQRHDSGVDVDVGELYLDFEDVSKLWGQDRQLNIRVGRTDVPFGEEYLTRDAIDNPLISHSVTDFWGVDEGVELYGTLGGVNYIVAVQNGGVPVARDFNKDKSVIGRVSYDPTRWLHLSVSGMRTGDLDAAADRDCLSELWFGGGWFRSIGSASTTKFHAELVQGDIAVHCPHGHLKAYGGYAHYDDDDPLGDNQRDIYFYTVEGIGNITRKLYAAARFSEIFVHNGYPLPGNGDMGQYFFNPFGPQAEVLWRLSLGLGYRFSKNLVLKAEYSFEQAKEVSGATRDDVNFFGAEAAFAF